MTSKVTLEIHGDKEVMALLDRLPKLVVSAGGVLDKAVQAPANLVAKRARQIAPDSRQTGSRKKQSRASRAKWPATLRQTIRVKLARYPTTRVAIVGAKSPEGNMAHFAQEKPRRMILWGRAVYPREYRIARNWITQAFDETRSQQLDAMRAVLRVEVDRHMRSN